MKNQIRTKREQMKLFCVVNLVSVDESVSPVSQILLALNHFFFHQWLWDEKKDTFRTLTESQMKDPYLRVKKTWRNKTTKRDMETRVRNNRKLYYVGIPEKNGEKMQKKRSFYPVFLYYVVWRMYLFWCVSQGRISLFLLLSHDDPSMSLLQVYLRLKWQCSHMSLKFEVTWKPLVEGERIPQTRM